jgi:hypothetical protein
METRRAMTAYCHLAIPLKDSHVVLATCVDLAVVEEFTPRNVVKEHPCVTLDSCKIGDDSLTAYGVFHYLRPRHFASGVGRNVQLVGVQSDWFVEWATLRMALNSM